MEIRESENGLCQVWAGDKVLRPNALTWEDSHQAAHYFMYFENIEEAKEAAEWVRKKENIVKIHQL